MLKKCEWPDCTAPKANQKNSRCKWCSEHRKAASNANAVRYYKSDPEKMRAKARERDPAKTAAANRRAREKCDKDPARKAARREKRRAWEAANWERVREYNREYQKEYRLLPRTPLTTEERKRLSDRQRDYTYGLRRGDFEKMWDSQCGKCASCARSMTLEKRSRNRCHVDHDHVTGVVRGLLCAGCNQGLGSFRDDIASLLGAVEYLRRYKSL